MNSFAASARRCIAMRCAIKSESRIDRLRVAVRTAERCAAAGHQESRSAVQRSGRRLWRSLAATGPGAHDRIIPGDHHQFQRPGADALPRHGLDAAADGVRERGDLAGGAGSGFPARRLHEIHDRRRSGADRSDAQRSFADSPPRGTGASRTPDEAAKVLSDAELRYLRNQTILAIHCTYLGESLASIVLFRDGAKPFSPEDAATLRAIGPVFAIALATMVRGKWMTRGDGASRRTRMTARSWMSRMIRLRRGGERKTIRSGGSAANRRRFENPGGGTAPTGLEQAAPPPIGPQNSQEKNRRNRLFFRRVFFTSK